MIVHPRRIQRQLTKGWRLPSNTVCVTRPGPFGNPSTFVGTRGDSPEADLSRRRRAVEVFRAYVGPELGPQIALERGLVDARARLFARLPELRGKNLACWCPLGAPCHADVLLELANGLVCEEVG